MGEWRAGATPLWLVEIRDPLAVDRRVGAIGRSTGSPVSLGPCPKKTASNPRIAPGESEAANNNHFNDLTESTDPADNNQRTYRKTSVLLHQARAEPEQQGQQCKTTSNVGGRFGNHDLVSNKRTLATSKGNNVRTSVK